MHARAIDQRLEGDNRLPWARPADDESRTVTGQPAIRNLIEAFNAGSGFFYGVVRGYCLIGTSHLRELLRLKRLIVSGAVPAAPNANQRPRTGPVAGTGPLKWVHEFL